MFDLSARNPLVNVKPNKLWLIDVDVNNAINVYKKQQFFLKEYALQTSLLVSHFIKWKHPQKDKFYTSPLFITPVRIIKNQKIELNFKFEVLDENPTINPIIENAYKTIFNIEFNSELSIEESIHHLAQTLETNGSHISFTNCFSNVEQWEIISINAIGTFNYKKAVLAQDYTRLIQQPNASVLSLLGETTNVTKEFKDDSVEVVNLNQSQIKAVKHSLKNHTVIQGPPGTGKSNTIVELIKQCLLEHKTVLFVSEKKSALDVVYQKLNAEGLHQLSAYFDGSKQQKKQFYHLLKQSLHQVQTVTSNTNEQQVDRKINEINALFETYLSLTKKDVQQEVSVKALFDEIITHNYKNIQIKTAIPAYKLWMKYVTFLEELEEVVTPIFRVLTPNKHVATLNELSFIYLNKAVFTQNHPIDLLNKRLNELKSILQSFTELDAIYNLNWSWDDWSKHSVASSVLQMANLSQLEILDPNTKKYKAFNIWTKKYDVLKHKVKIADSLNDNWNIKPKHNQIDDLIDELTHFKPNFFSRFKSSKAKEAFKHYKHKISVSQQIEVLNQLKTYYQLKFDLEEITIKLKHNLGILNPDIEINQLMAMRQKLESNSHQQYVFLLEHPQSLQLIEDLHQLQPKIQQAQQIKRFLFRQYTEISIENLHQIINHIQLDLPHYNYHLPEIKKLLSLPQEVIEFIKQNPLSVHQLTGIVVHHTLRQLLKFEPHLKQLSGKQLQNEFKTLKELKTIKNQQINQQIIANQQAFWQQTETLIQTPATKLKPEQKRLKKEVKQSKKLIFHESAKQQQHLPVKLLIEQTEHLLFNILPVWMMNPLSIAESLPCKPDVFDVIIFDEASQIPLEDSLPAVYRAKQMVVVGDSKQMPPSRFFSTQKETVSLLMEAESSLTSKMLTTHYRSHHPKLMQFSNRQFYDNELNYLPPATNEPPFILNYNKEGRFENGKNSIEAKVVANVYHQYLKNGKKDVGIIAFSVEQEQEIIKQIKALNLPDNDKLLIRNLENAQGIEKEYVIISVGYGFNNEGKFRQHFGPLNQAFGANRLNVLLTRSQKQITICTSIKSTDFKLSDNRGVQLLKDYLTFVEQEHQTTPQMPEVELHQLVGEWLKTDSNITFTKAVNGQMINAFIDDNQKLLLIDPCLNSNETEDIYTLLDVLSDRFSKVKIVLSKDYIENQTRFKDEVLEYFLK